MKDENTYSLKRCNRCGHEEIPFWKDRWVCNTCAPITENFLQRSASVSNLNGTDAHLGFLKIGVYTLEHEKFDGTMTETITREVMERGNAVAVLPYDPTLDEVLLTSQFLIGAHLAGKPNRPPQVVAGMVEEGETPIEVARREAEEEAGCTIGRIIPAQGFLPSPGGTSEWVETFIAEADLSDAGGIFGLDEEDEDILAFRVPAKIAIEMLDSGQVTSGLAVIVLSWFARHHEKIRKEWLNTQGV